LYIDVRRKASLVVFIASRLEPVMAEAAPEPSERRPVDIMLLLKPRGEPPVLGRVRGELHTAKRRRISENVLKRAKEPGVATPGVDPRGAGAARGHGARRDRRQHARVRVLPSAAFPSSLSVSAWRVARRACECAGWRTRRVTLVTRKERWS